MSRRRFTVLPSKALAARLAALFALALPLAGCVLDAQPTDVDDELGATEGELDLQQSLLGVPSGGVDDPEDPSGGPEPTPWRAASTETKTGGDPGPGPDLKAQASQGSGSSDE